MALTDENGGMNTTILVSPAATMGAPYPVYAQGAGSNGFGGDGNGWWIILLFILLASGNWGNNNGGNGGGFGSGGPIVINDGNNGVQRGFDQAAVMAGINGLQGGIYGLQTQLCNCCGDISAQLCNGFSGVNATINSTAANAETAANARAMANMQQLFGLSQQFSDCCCENRLATANLANTITREACDDRYAAAQNTRDIIENCTRNNQTVLDKLCQLELDAKNDKIADLERQLTAANFSASQIAQTAQIQRGQTAEVDALYARLRDCPVPTMPVYGMTPIFSCPNNSGCGCNGGNF